MNNKQVLEIIDISNHLLKGYGDITRMTDKDKQEKARKKMDKSVGQMQKRCTHPYIMASVPLDAKEAEYTCLVCGKELEQVPDLDKVVNQSGVDVIEDFGLEDRAVNILREYLQTESALSEEEIREALRKDVIDLVHKR